MTDGQRDQVARDIANSALARIDRHEAVCTERWNEGRADMAAVRRGIEGLYSRLWLAAVAIIGVLLSTSGFLIAHSFVTR